MRKPPPKYVRRRLTSNSKESKRKRGPVTANDVVSGLWTLFDQLDIELSEPKQRALKSLKKRKSVPDTLYPYTAAIGEMLTNWYQDPEYLDDRGNPLPIKLRGARPSFKSLVQRFLPKMDEGKLISELERLGAVKIDDTNFIHVQMRSFPAYEDKDLAVEHTLTILHGFIQTLRHNLKSAPSNSNQLFHRIAWNANFARKEIPALKVRVKRHGQSFLESFDNWLTRKSLPNKSTLGRGSRRSKVSIGVYLSVDDS